MGFPTAFAVRGPSSFPARVDTLPRTDSAERLPFRHFGLRANYLHSVAEGRLELPMKSV